MAYRFETFKEDTLRGVKMYFNRTLDDFSQKYFKLGVWAHDTEQDAPGELIHSMAGVRPEYWGLNEFFTYHLDTTIILTGLFYVGWIKTTEYMLNVGWDVWNNHRDKIFYNKGQGWVNSSKSGCLMIRPVMGKELSFPASKKEIPEIRLQVYPNPATESFYLELPQGMSAGEWTVSLYNLQGKRVYVDRSGEVQHFIGDLAAGLYIIRVDQGGIFRASTKLMILR